jgi:molybdate transport system ATP-binding protein
MADALRAQFTKRFASGAAVHADFEAPAKGRHVTVLFGPSGCGKTTVLRCLAGLEKPDDGAITLGNEDWTSLEPQRRGVGFVSQDYALFPHLTVAQNVAFGSGSVQGLERFKLQDLRNRYPRELSGGQQQRVALARALARRPRLLLLDEPLSALDAPLREELRSQLIDFLAECDVPVVLVTHDRDEALALGDQIVVMSEGRTLQQGNALEVFQRPASPEVARIVRVENIQAGIVESSVDGLAKVAVGSVVLTAVSPLKERDVFVCIRGEDVALERSVGAGSARNRLKARVIAIAPGSPLMRIQLDAGFPLFALVTRPAAEELQLRPGAEVTAVIKAPAIHLIPKR